MSGEIDKYQRRYLEHQAKKRDQLAPASGEPTGETHPDERRDAFLQLLAARRSQRIFNSKPVEPEKIDLLAEAMAKTPSSCNRQAISVRMISERDEKELLSGLLVGGVGWAHRADRLLLLFADMDAYKSPAERDFMPYLDAGAMIMTISLAAESLNLGAAYVNPNVRDANKPFFRERFGADNLTFCGAIALGYFDTRAKESPKRPANEVWIK